MDPGRKNQLFQQALGMRMIQWKEAKMGCIEASGCRRCENKSRMVRYKVVGAEEEQVLYG